MSEESVLLHIGDVKTYGYGSAGKTYSAVTVGTDTAKKLYCGFAGARVQTIELILIGKHVLKECICIEWITRGCVLKAEGNNYLVSHEVLDLIDLVGNEFSHNFVVVIGVVNNLVVGALALAEKELLKGRELVGILDIAESDNSALSLTPYTADRAVEGDVYVGLLADDVGKDSSGAVIVNVEDGGNAREHVLFVRLQRILSGVVHIELNSAKLLANGKTYEFCSVGFRKIVKVDDCVTVVLYADTPYRVAISDL